MLTQFQKQVYETIKRIPRGKVMIYKDVARALGRPRAYRAVGNALNKNTDPTVPCHRVIRSDGSVGGYRKGVKKKIELLKKDGIIKLSRSSNSSTNY